MFNCAGRQCNSRAIFFIQRIAIARPRWRKIDKFEEYTVETLWMRKEWKFPLYVLQDIHKIQLFNKNTKRLIIKYKVRIHPRRYILFHTKPN